MPTPSQDAASSSGEAPPAAEGGVLVVSNRLPFTFRSGPAGLEVRPSAGGLVTALAPLLSRRGGTWVGWPGPDAPPGLGPSRHDGYQVVPVPLAPEEVEGFYQGCSNSTLWPLFHSLVDRASFRPDDWECYERVNQRFARATLEAARDEALIWVHDYQLMRAPEAIRAGARDKRLAFFLHIPFPPYDLFRLLPWDRELLRGVLACDLIGFHVEGYVHNFLDCAERLLGLRVDRRARRVEYDGRTVQVGAFPLGIDFARFDWLARRAAPPPPSEERLLLGVDRLDYTKGLPQRMRAFELLLEQRPELREKVSLLQLAVPSRTRVVEYQQLKRELDEEVGRINGRFGTPRWTPIRYLYRSLPAEELAGLYRDADVALVTPLRDGMNLVAKEYVACQVADPGVLVLSRLAGAAETMREAILVNPYAVDRVAAALARALEMDEGERRSRMAALRARERRRNVDAWAEGLLGAALAPTPSWSAPSDDDYSAWLAPLLGRSRVCLFLDFDGTLAPIAPHPDLARLPEETRATLQACVAHPLLDVAVISGRSLAELSARLEIPGLILAGNHGLEISGPGLPPFRLPGLEPFAGATARAAAALRELARDGAWLEEKGPTLTFHFRQAPPEQQAALAERARQAIQAEGLVARDAHAAVEARPPLPWDKGRAVLHILRHLHGPDWPERVRVLYAGDDLTDEDAFRVLAGLGLTFRIGPQARPTAALRTLPGTESLRALLAWLVLHKD